MSATVAPSRVIDRIKSRVVVTDDGCWQWTRALTNGYGQIGWHEGGMPHHALVHRVMFEAEVGAIPAELSLDHLCHNANECAGGARCPHRRCCNPEHLKPVTTRVNVLRGCGFAAENASKTTCPQGHPYTSANTYVDPASGWRQCRTCRSEHARAFRARSAR